MLVSNPKMLIIIGASMLLGGWLITFLMVIGIIEENFYLVMLAYGINLIGLFIGLYGITSYIFIKKYREET